MIIIFVSRCRMACNIIIYIIYIVERDWSVMSDVWAFVACAHAVHAIYCIVIKLIVDVFFIYLLFFIYWCKSQTLTRRLAISVYLFTQFTNSKICLRFLFSPPETSSPYLYVIQGTISRPVLDAITSTECVNTVVLQCCILYYIYAEKSSTSRLPAGTDWAI